MELFPCHRDLDLMTSFRAVLPNFPDDPYLTEN